MLGKANLAPWASKDRITKSQGMSNLQLAEKVARVGAPESSKNPENSPQNQWAALHAALQSVEKIPKRQILVQLYRSARTYFIKNCWKLPDPPRGSAPRKRGKQRPQNSFSF